MLQTGRLMTLLLAGIAATGTVASAADPSLLNLVMPDAKILAGANATSMRISPFGVFIASKISAIAQDPHLASIGFNPLQDVSEILVATSADPSNPDGILLASGNFPVEKITTALAGRTNPQIESYNGATLIVDSGKDSKVVHAIAFLGTNIAIAGDLTAVKAAVDRQTNPTSIDSAFAVKVNQLSGSQDDWVVSIAPIASLLPATATTASATTGPAAQILPLLKSIQSFDGGIKFDKTVTFTGEAVTSNAQNATSLQAVVKLGLLLVSSVDTSKNAQLAELVTLLQSMQVSINGTAVELALSVQESQLEALVNSISAPTTRSTPSPAARPRRPSVN
jgi:hypothetical protein